MFYKICYSAAEIFISHEVPQIFSYIRDTQVRIQYIPHFMTES